MQPHERAWARRQAAARKRRDLREMVVSYKGGGCNICGYNTCLAGLDLHHPDLYIGQGRPYFHSKHNLCLHLPNVIVTDDESSPPHFLA